MPEPNLKLPQSASPVARTGGGDISERELSQERSNLHSTPQPVRQHPHPKKQLFSVPVNKFTAKFTARSGNAVRLRGCLATYQHGGEAETSTPARRPAPRPKAVSMEDLTPKKRFRREGTDLSPVRSPLPRDSTERQAAERIGRLLLVAVWRRRRDEVRCLRRTLEAQVSCSEKLRIQVSTLKSLLDSDNAKVRLAMRELERLKQLLRDKEMEKAVLEREKKALENDVCEAEDRASEMSIGWRNARNDLECARAAAALAEHQLRCERAAAADVRAQRDRAFARLSELEGDIAEHEELLQTARAEEAALRHQLAGTRAQLDQATEKLKAERQARELCARECETLRAQVSASAAETESLKSSVAELHAEVCRLDGALRLTTERLEWWPSPLTTMMGAARKLLRYPPRCARYVPAALLWSLVPARHGC